MTSIRSSLANKVAKPPITEAEMRALQDQVNSRSVGVFLFWSDLVDDFERQIVKNIVNRLKGRK